MLALRHFSCENREDAVTQTNSYRVSDNATKTGSQLRASVMIYRAPRLSDFVFKKFNADFTKSN
jgi:hypothetical protein